MTNSSARTSALPMAVLAAVGLLTFSAWTGVASAQVCYSQPFGNPDLADPWGCTGACGRSNPHRGLDYPEPCGTPIPAIADGVVVMNTYSGCLGWLVVLAHADGMFSGYNHMPTQSPLGVGASVARGQIVGVVGNEGTCSFGCHLHLTVDYTAEGNWSGYYADVQVDPWSWIENHRVCRPDHDGDGSPQGDDCDDSNAHRRPGLAESCDAVDNDCDSAIDENVSRVCGSDVGACRVGTETCAAGEWGACLGGNLATDESCDTLDNDCDGESDEERICDDEDAALALSSEASSDVDGDGHFDVCVRTPAGFECLLGSSTRFDRVVRGPAMADEAGWSDRSFYTSVRMGDVDGDGQDDVCARDGEHIVCWGASAQGFTQSVMTVPLGEPSPEARNAEVWLADVDGDGAADVCVRDVDGLRCQPRVGRALELAALSDEAGWADVTRHGSIRFGDVDGDGRDDVCARGATGLVCWRARAAGFERQAIPGPAWTDALGWSEARYGSTIRLVDVDGDRRADACGRGPDGFACWRSSGARFEEPSSGPAMRGVSWDERGVYSTLRMGDVDGDRASDLCARLPDGARCWLWTGDGFDREILGPPLTDEDGWSAAPRYGSIRLGDVSGDGRADLCARAAEGMRCWISDGQSFPRLWIAPSWSDALGLSDPALGSSLTLAGIGVPTHRSVRLVGGCHVGVGRSRHGAWVVALLLGLVLLRRSRKGGALLVALLGLAWAVPASAQTCYQVPFDTGTITDPWGCAAACGRSNPHRGVDFGVGCGSPIPAVADGTVTANEHSGCLGWVIAIQHPDGVTSGYAHMPTQSPLAIGTPVTRGQIIGTSGAEGTCADGCHLHMTMGTSPDSWWTGTTFDPIGYIAGHTTCSCDRSNGHLTFSCDGANAGAHCVSVDEPADSDSWHDNYLCTPGDEGIVFSTHGPVEGMQCAMLSESADAHASAWSDDFACAAPDAAYELRWSSAGPIAGWSCVQFNEPSDPGTWNDNYLCERGVPCFHAGGFTFCSNGPSAGESCVSVDEPSDPDTWNDNFFCASDAVGGSSVGLVWSYDRPVAGMRCTSVSEPADPQASAWADNYLCVPPDSDYEFTWSSAGPIAGLDCVRWYEASDLHGTWNDNYLCVRYVGAADAGPVNPDAGPRAGDGGLGHTDASATRDAGASSVRPLQGGCACDITGRSARPTGAFLGAIVALGLVMARKRRTRVS